METLEIFRTVPLKPEVELNGTIPSSNLHLIGTKFRF